MNSRSVFGGGQTMNSRSVFGGGHTMNSRSVFGGGQNHEQSVGVWGWSKP